jgi:hypothetical protein
VIEFIQGQLTFEEEHRKQFADAMANNTAQA